MSQVNVSFSAQLRSYSLRVVAQVSEANSKFVSYHRHKFHQPNPCLPRNIQRQFDARVIPRRDDCNRNRIFVSEYQCVQIDAVTPPADVLTLVRPD